MVREGPLGEAIIDTLFVLCSECGESHHVPEIERFWGTGDFDGADYIMLSFKCPKTEEWVYVKLGEPRD